MPQIRCRNIPSYPGKRGGRTSSRTRGRMRWTRDASARKVIAGRSQIRERFTARRTNGAEAYGKTVWSWHPLLVPSCRWRVRSDRIGLAIKPAATVTRRIRRRGEHGISRKAIARGMPECSDCTCMLVCAFFRTICTRDRGCSVHPAFPAPSLLEGQVRAKSRALSARRDRRVMFSRHHPHAGDPVFQRQ